MAQQRSQVSTVRASTCLRVWILTDRRPPRIPEARGRDKTGAMQQYHILQNLNPDAAARLLSAIR